MPNQTIAGLVYDWTLSGDGTTAFFIPQADGFVPLAMGEARAIAWEVGAGLQALGVVPGDRVAVMAGTRYEWELADAGIMMIGAAVVAIYPNSTASDTRFILEHSRTRVAIIENAAQWHKLSAAAVRGDTLEHVVVIDPAGIGTGDWMSLDALRARGRATLLDDPNLVARSVAGVKPDDRASLVYTSGTTGVPKGVSLTHGNLRAVTEMLRSALPQLENPTNVVYLPLSHILGRVNSYFAKLVRAVNYFAPDVTALVPTCLVANPGTISGTPRVFEKIHGRIVAVAAEQRFTRRKLFELAIRIGIKRARLLNDGERPSAVLEAGYRQCDRLVFRQIRKRIFGLRIASAFSGAAPMSREVLEFFHAIGVPIFEGYGLTETSSPVTLNLPDDYRMGTVGKPLPGCEVRIADDGEVLLRGPGVFKGYYDNDAADAESFDDDGWFRSGDIGELDGDGFLILTDRKKNLIVTSGGKNIAPSPIEVRLARHPAVSQVMIHGDRRRYAVALMTLDPDGAAAWARRYGLAELALPALAQEPRLRADVETFVGSINESLSRHETIKYFHLLAEEFSIDNGLVTPSMKVRRRAVEERYGELLDSMYEGD